MSVATEPEARTKLTPLVAGIYSNYPCRKQSGGGKMVPDAVVDLGDAGPVMLFWQCSARTGSANRTLKVEPEVNGKPQSALGTWTHVNPANVHAPLLRRRALTEPLPQGQSIFGVNAGDGVVTDQNDTVNMLALDVSDMSKPPQVRLDRWGNAGGPPNYTQQGFNSNGGPLLVSIAATGRPKQKGQFVEAFLFLDNMPVAAIQIFANQSDQHIHIVGGDRVIKASAGSHTLKLVAGQDTIIDQNDYWSLTVMEFQSPSSVTQVLDNAKCENQQGDGLIAKGTYESKGGQHMICVWLSGYAHQADRAVEARVFVDENPVGRLRIFANQAETHTHLCGGDIAPGALPPGKHTIAVFAANKDTITDFNDRCSMTVLEVYR